MRKIILSSLFLLCFASFVFAQADQLTLTTYYPAPFGMYQEMRVMGKLGVGTTNPQAKAHISDEDNVKNVTLTVENTGIMGVDLWLKRPTATQTSTIIFGNVGNFGTLSFGNGNHFAFNRNVGIGTPTPYAPLHVKNDGSQNYTSVFEEPGNVASRYAIIAYQGMMPQSPTTRGGIFVKAANDAYGIYQAGGAANYFASNVGIGVTAPSARLEATASSGYTAQLSNTGTSNNEYALRLDNSGIAKAMNTGYGGLYVLAQDVGSYGVHQAGVNAYNYFAGKVGVGTSIPAIGSKLHVESTGGQEIVWIKSSDVAGSSGFTLARGANDDRYTLFTNGGDMYLSRYRNGVGHVDSNFLIIKDQGSPNGANFGFGVAAPAAKIDVDGGIKIGNTTATCNASRAGTLKFNPAESFNCGGSSYTTSTLRVCSRNASNVWGWYQVTGTWNGACGGALPD
ncbi:MAG TPA: hypothetical protein PKO44_08265 [Candidatus Omnitrophota bacterium]|mgnify:CR=1 FL=1|nr:hypothetical protein [Candidatus Omnitrophota bacterium]